MADKIKVTSANGGGQWWKSITWAAKAFEKSGFEVAVSRAGGWNDPLYRVSSGAADVAVSLTVGAAMAAKSVGPYEGGKTAHIRALARLVRPDQHFFNMVRADLGVRSFAELAQKKPRLTASVELTDYGPGWITELYLRHYGIELMRDIEAWGGSLITSHPNTLPRLLDGSCNAIFRTDTSAGPAGIATHLGEWVLLPLDRDIAEKLQREYCCPMTTIAPDFLRGLANTEPCLTVTNPGFDLVVGEHLPEDVVYHLAKALNETSERAWAAQDVFYSIRHAAETPTPLHPGAARYYREQRVLQ
ncbi:MAG TPA: TAXI family TRAP transporter solute-binding subunit [Stellaceae bacterium]|nr:TAXI family TRAP transporter solute-binding subunit [Stellaceae bacterium]